jgi:predicted nucleic acid-binding protein
MNIFAVDTSCMIAAVCGWHENNPATVTEIDRRIRRGERLTVSAHALAEAYSVLTRLPAPYRLSPGDAWALLEANFVTSRSIVALDSAAHVSLLRQLAQQGLGGGRTYDAVIAACARQSGATTLLTLNRRHFDPSPEGVTIVEPGMD